MEKRTIDWWRNLALGDARRWEDEILAVMEILRCEKDYRTAISVLEADALVKRAGELRRRFPAKGGSGSGGGSSSGGGEAAGEPPGGVPALFGVPLAVKDNIDVKGFPTTAACPDYSYRPRESAFAVRLLEDAGALVIAKTNMDQFATGLGGLRSPFAPPRNPLNGDYIPGGSSSGSAVAAARNLVPISLGTDTAGSGRVPAFMNGIFGLKPSRGRISSRGVVPACPSLDTVSLFSASLDDICTAAEIITRCDPQDPFSRYRECPCSPGMPREVLVPREDQLFFNDDKLCAGLWDDWLGHLEGLGVSVRPVDIGALLEAAKLLYEDAWVAERTAALGDFIDAHPESLHPVTRRVLGSAGRYSAADAFKVTWKTKAAAACAEKLLSPRKILITPTVPRPVKTAELETEPIALNSTLGCYTNFMNLLDLSGLAVPWGEYGNSGLKWGVTLIGEAGMDNQLTAAAAALLQMEDSGPQEVSGYIDIAVCGAHLEGFPLNGQLTDRGAFLLRRARTAKRYRMVLIDDAAAPKPGLILRPENPHSEGFPVEIWRMPNRELAEFVQLIDKPLGLGRVELESGESPWGFVCGSSSGDYPDISESGGWANFVRAGKPG